MNGTADNYIAAARVMIERDCNLSRQAFLAEDSCWFATYPPVSCRRGQHQVVVNAISLQAELVGLTGKTA